MPSATALVSEAPVATPRPEKTWRRPETVPIRPINGAMPVITSSTIKPRSSRTSSRRARVCTDSMFSARGQRKCCKAVRTTPASEELSSFTMRISRSALPPGVSRSISLSMTRGSTFFSRKVRVARTSVVTVTIEQRRSGHMNSPPVVRNFNIAWSVSVIWKRRAAQSLVPVQDKRQLLLQTFRWQRAGNIRRNGRQFQLLDRLEADDREGLVGGIFHDLQIGDASGTVDRKGQPGGADADQVALLRGVFVPACADGVVHLLLVTPERSADGVDRGRTAIGDAACAPRLLFLGLITGRGSLGLRPGNERRQ